jgi:hypothetical protein
MRRQLKEVLNEMSLRLPGLVFAGICDAETSEPLASIEKDEKDGVDALAASAVMGDMLTQQSWAVEALGGHERVGETLDLVVTTRNMSVIIAPLDDVRCYVVMAVRKEEHLDVARLLIRENRGSLSCIIAGWPLAGKQEVLSC